MIHTPDQHRHATPSPVSAFPGGGGGAVQGCGGVSRAALRVRCYVKQGLPWCHEPQFRPAAIAHPSECNAHSPTHAMRLAFSNALRSK